MKKISLMLTAVLLTTAMSLSAFASTVTISGFEGSTLEKYLIESNAYMTRNVTEMRSDYPRKAADTPVESIYKDTPENNIEGQFDMAGAIKAFEFMQAHRFYKGYSETYPLDAFEWDDTLAGFAQKMLLDNITLGGLDTNYVFDTTGLYDQSRVYSYATYFPAISGYPNNIDRSFIYVGSTVDEAIMSYYNAPNNSSVFAQNKKARKVGAAVLNYNGQKLLLYLFSDEGDAVKWRSTNKVNTPEACVKERSVSIDLIPVLYEREYYGFGAMQQLFSNLAG